MQQWCDIYSLPRSIVNRRLELGWDIEKALTTPKRERDTDGLIGKEFGYLTVKKFDSVSENRQSVYQCECICGNICYVNGNKLKSGHTRSCGCMKYKMRKSNK